jgi:hypothetical protein
VYDCVGTLIYHLPRHDKLLTNVVPCVLSVAEVMIRNLQLLVLLGRRNYTTMEKVILALQLCELPGCGSVTLLTSFHAEMLLNDCHIYVVLQVEQALGILSHHSHAYVVMWTLGVRYVLKTLLPHGISRVVKQKSASGVVAVLARRLPHSEARTKCAALSTGRLAPHP